MATADASAATSAAAMPAQWFQPSAAIMIGNGASENSTSESSDPDSADANSSAEQVPAPSPINPTCSQNCAINSCPARFEERLETDQPSVPTFARRTAHALTLFLRLGGSTPEVGSAGQRIT